MLINRFVIIHPEMYHCKMDVELTAVKSYQVKLEDNTRYTYTIKPVEITNLLGVVITTLLIRRQLLFQNYWMESSLIFWNLDELAKALQLQMM